MLYISIYLFEERVPQPALDASTSDIGFILSRENIIPLGFASSDNT